jgi:hypothetical protein
MPSRRDDVLISPPRLLESALAVRFAFNQATRAFLSSSRELVRAARHAPVIQREPFYLTQAPDSAGSLAFTGS